MKASRNARALIGTGLFLLASGVLFFVSNDFSNARQSNRMNDQLYSLKTPSSWKSTDTKPTPKRLLNCGEFYASCASAGRHYRAPSSVTLEEVSQTVSGSLCIDAGTWTAPLKDSVPSVQKFYCQTQNGKLEVTLLREDNQSIIWYLLRENNHLI